MMLESKFRKYILPELCVLVCIVVAPITSFAQQKDNKFHEAPAPLYRDPIYDGAADPIVFWNPNTSSWWMLYSQRRANQESAGVAFCYGTSIGVATSQNHGQTWVYRGTLDLNFERGKNTFWAPDVVVDNGTFHLFVTYIRGVYDHWGGNAHIAHYTGKDLWDLKFSEFVKLPSEKVIDPDIFHMSNGEWGMWYKDEKRGSAIMKAVSNDLYHWQLIDEPAVDHHQEGPVVFQYGKWYWMLTDEWAGMRVYRSADLKSWRRQGRILTGPSPRTQDTPSGAHGDVVVLDNNKAYIFYFTHPGREKHTKAKMGGNGVIPYNLRRSSIQVAPLEIRNGTLISDRDHPFDFWLPDLQKNKITK